MLKTETRIAGLWKVTNTTKETLLWYWTLDLNMNYKVKMFPSWSCSLWPFTDLQKVKKLHCCVRKSLSSMFESTRCVRVLPGSTGQSSYMLKHYFWPWPIWRETHLITITHTLLATFGPCHPPSVWLLYLSQWWAATGRQSWRTHHPHRADCQQALTYTRYITTEPVPGPSSKSLRT